MRILSGLVPSLILISLLAGCAYNPETLVARCDKAGSPERGVRICGDAIKAEDLTPLQRAAILSDRGYYLVGLRRYDEAIADYDRSIELNPEAGGTYNRRGTAYWAKKNWDAALKDFNRAAEMTPELAEVFYGRGRVQFELGHYDEAMADYDQAIKLNPKYVEAYNSRGHTYFTLKQWDKAIPEYQHAIEIDPKFAGGYQNLATTHVELKQYQLAIQEYDRALELDPYNIFINAQRAVPRAWMGDVDGATEDAKTFLSVIDLLDRNPSGLNTSALKNKSLVLLGMIQIRQADYAAAIATFDRLVQSNPMMAEAYYMRGAVRRLAGDQAKADADCKTAIGIDPGIDKRMRTWLHI